MNTVTLFHNPRCSTSRNALALLRERGIEPHIVDYLKSPPTREQWQALGQATGEPLHGLLRTKEALFTELGLDAPGVTDAQLVDAMLLHPILINRPIVVTPRGARLCRPAEQVLEVLPAQD